MPCVLRFAMTVGILLAAACSGGPSGNEPEARSSGTQSALGAPPTTAPRASPNPTPAAIPEPVVGPTFVVNSQPVGCHAAPNADAAVMANLTPGVVQAMEALIRQPDGVWHRERDRQCWTRTDPGPVAVFRALDEAERYASALRLPPSPRAALPPTTPSPQTAGVCTDTAAAARVRPSVVRIDTSSGSGTGMVVGVNGSILTANHVVDDARSARVTLADGRVVNAQVLANRPDLDLAVLRADSTGLQTVTWGDDRALQLGQPLLALGYALGIRGEPSLTGGRFSQHIRDGSTQLLQVDIRLNPGNSGGPIFTPCGEVVGVVSFGLRRSAGDGLNFAVAAVHARALATGIATPPPAVSRSPLEAVRAYYSLLTHRDWPRAWALLSSGYRSQYPYERWVADFNQLPSITLERVEQGNTPSRVVAYVVATASTATGPETRRWVTDWDLVQDGGEWRLHQGIRR